MLIRCDVYTQITFLETNKFDKSHYVFFNSIIICKTHLFSTFTKYISIVKSYITHRVLYRDESNFKYGTLRIGLASQISPKICFPQALAPK